MQRLGPAAAVSAMVAYAAALVVMHGVMATPFQPVGWTNVLGFVNAAVALGLMRSGRSRAGAVLLLAGVVAENLADFALSPSPMHESLPFVPLVVAAAGLLAGIEWSVALAAVYLVALPVLVLVVPHVEPRSTLETALLAFAMLAVLAALWVVYAARRLYSSLLAQADAQAARARRLVERAPDAIVVMRHDGRVVESNRAAQRLFGPAGLDADERLPVRLLRHDGTLADADFLRGAADQLLRGRIVGTDRDVAIAGAVVEDDVAEPQYELILRVVNAVPRQSPTRGTRAPVEPSLRVLLVDDDDMVRAALGLQLSRAGCQVTSAADGEAALAEVRARGEEFDVMLSDVVMPGMTGPDLVRHVRALQSDLPVVLMSGDPRHLLRGLDVPGPAWVFIGKPFMLPDLKAAFAKAGAPVTVAH